MGIVITLRDIFALGILGLGLLALVYLYLHHKFNNWQRARRDRKQAERLKKAEAALAKE